MVRNTPDSGGFITRNYGHPERGVHALQIEINRSLYMNETTFERTDGMAEVALHMRHLVEQLAELDSASLTT